MILLPRSLLHLSQKTGNINIKRSAQLTEIGAWCLYDWACAAFSIIVTTFVFATYFTSKVAVDPIIGTYQWANATVCAGMFIALTSPIFGAIADHAGHHKIWLGGFTLLALIGSAFLWFAYPTPNSTYFFLACVIIATIGYEIAQVFYNIFLTQLAPPAYLGRISGWGWGAGYIGGIVALSICLFIFVEPKFGFLNTDSAEQIRICGPFVALWYGLFALPLFYFVKPIAVKNESLPRAIHLGIKELFRTLKKLPKEKNIALYLIAHMVYTDGLNTLFAFGGIYAAGTYGLTFSEVLLFGISMNIAAGIGAILFGWVDDFFGSKETVIISLICLILLGIPIVLLQDKTIFWAMALLLCLFVGPVQAASRSLMVKLIGAKNISGEMFGLYALSGRITAFVGPGLLGFATYYFGSQRFGIASILLFFMLGIALLIPVKVIRYHSLD